MTVAEPAPCVSPALSAHRLIVGHQRALDVDTSGERLAREHRYRRQRQDGTNVLLFVRENPTLASGAGAPFTFLGPATLVDHRGERPMQITWHLREPMPESLLEVARLVAA